MLLPKICRYLCILILYEICLYKIILLSSMKGQHKSGDMKQRLFCVHDRRCPSFKFPKLNCSLTKSSPDKCGSNGFVSIVWRKCVCLFINQIYSNFKIEV